MLNNIILIGERPSEARDNGYWIFKYIRENHPKIDIFYVINEDSSDFHKISELGNYVIYDSEEHKEIFTKASILISTHSRGNIEPSDFDKTKAELIYKDYYKKKYFFLGHGITVGGTVLNAFSKNNKINANFSKIICGAYPEYNYLSKWLEYDEDVITYTGLARFDNLFNQKTSWGKENRIIFIPTWRSDICSPSYKKTKTMNDFRILKSNYYSRILNLLNSKKLQNLLSINNLEFHFIPHPEVSKYLHYFTTQNKNVKIIDPKTIDLQSELINAKILITDYSSIFFDFAYMEKPIVFYQFDKEDFFKKHYQKGYFDFDRHTFGNTVTKKNKLIKNIEKIIKNNFQISDTVKFTSKDFFKLKDNNNCARIWNEIEKCINT